LGFGLVASTLWARVLVGEKAEGFGADCFPGFLTALLFLDSQIQFVGGPFKILFCLLNDVKVIVLLNGMKEVFQDSGF